MQDSQRNIVFPDTAAHEARIWRNIISGNGKMSLLQIRSLVVSRIVESGPTVHTFPLSSPLDDGCHFLIGCEVPSMSLSEAFPYFFNLTVAEFDIVG